MIVVDASVIVKLLVPEPDSEIADACLRQVRDVIAPDLLAVEVAQAIVRRVNDRRASKTAGEKALRGWRDLVVSGGVTLIRSDLAQVEHAAAIAIALGHPVKDCLYLALGIANDADLITSDAKFAAKACIAYPQVKLLTDAAS